MYPEVIYLYNRAGKPSIRLKHIEKLTYEVEQIEAYYIRMMRDHDGTIKAIDPEGGPYISLDYKVEEGLFIDDILINEENKSFVVNLIQK